MNNLYDSAWILLIEGKIFGNEQGRCAWYRKSDIVNAFKCSEYWENIKSRIESENPGIGHYRLIDLCRAEYKRLIESGIIEYKQIVCD